MICSLPTSLIRTIRRTTGMNSRGRSFRASYLNSGMLSSFTDGWKNWSDSHCLKCASSPIITDRLATRCIRSQNWDGPSPGDIPYVRPRTSKHAGAHHRFHVPSRTHLWVRHILSYSTHRALSSPLSRIRLIHRLLYSESVLTTTQRRESRGP